MASSLSTARSSSLTLLAIGWAVPGGPINAKKPSASRECRQRCEEERVAVRRRRAGHLYADRAGRAGRNILSPSEMIPIAHNQLIMHKVDYEVHFGPRRAPPKAEADVGRQVYSRWLSVFAELKLRVDVGVKT